MRTLHSFAGMALDSTAPYRRAMMLGLALAMSSQAIWAMLATVGGQADRLRPYTLAQPLCLSAAS